MGHSLHVPPVCSLYSPVAQTIQVSESSCKVSVTVSIISVPSGQFLQLVIPVWSVYVLVVQTVQSVYWSA